MSLQTILLVTVVLSVITVSVCMIDNTEGILRTKTITRIATHKLIGQDNRIYLLKSRGENLDSFNNRKIKVTGKLENPAAKNPIIEVEKIEALD